VGKNRPIFLYWLPESGYITNQPITVLIERGNGMGHIFKPLICVVACFLFSGCAVVTTMEGKTSSASSIGDRHTVSLDEIVVSVPVPDKPDQYQNLHVFFSAIVDSEKSDWDLDAYEVGRMVGRLSTRLSASTVEKLLEFGPVSVKDFSSIRKQLVSTAQQTFDSAFSKWTRAAEFKVEIVIVSLYLTDASVGKEREPGRFW
jgi:hypothetical protein